MSPVRKTAACTGRLRNISRPIRGSPACLCFALDQEEQQLTDFRYDYSVYQCEYSRNYVFTRSKDLVRGIPGHRRDEVSPEGLRPLVALWVRRERVIFPLLSRHGQLSRGPLKHQRTLDAQYHRLQREMQALFKLLNIAA